MISGIPIYYKWFPHKTILRIDGTLIVVSNPDQSEPGFGIK